MIIELGLTGGDRKELAKAISEIIGAPAEYQYMPTCAYIIGGHYTLTKEGNLEISDRANSKEVENLINELAGRGYDVPLEDDETEDEGTRLTIEMPRERIDDNSIDRLRKIVENKGELFKAAFKTDSLEIEVTDEKVSFPWFTIEQHDDSTAYSNFVYLLCEFAKNQKRINNKPETTDNQKYTMRCYLLRLGMIGADYKNARKVILRNLEGSAAFRKAVNDDAVSE